MNSQSHKAAKFVAIAHFHNRPSTEQDVGSNVVKSISINPDTTVAEIFAAFWPDDGAISPLTQKPFRLELVPDEATIPEDPFLENMKEIYGFG